MAKDTGLSDEEIWLLVTDPTWVQPEYARLLARELQEARAAIRSRDETFNRAVDELLERNAGEIEEARQHLRDAMRAGRDAERARIVAWLREPRAEGFAAQATLRWAADRLAEEA